MNALRILVKILVIAGALNWGLIGFFGYNLLGNILGGDMSAGARIVYALVGLAGVVCLLRWGCKCCGSCKGCGCCGKCTCSKGSCGTKKDWKE